MKVLAFNSKKGTVDKPYLATISPEGQRTFGTRFAKSTGTTKAATLPVQPGDLIDGRASSWNGDRFEGGHFLAVVLAKELFFVARDTMFETLVPLYKQGYRVIGTIGTDVATLHSDGPLISEIIANSNAWVITGTTIEGDGSHLPVATATGADGTYFVMKNAEGRLIAVGFVSLQDGYCRPRQTVFLEADE